MNIFVNDTPKVLGASATITQLLLHIEMQQTRGVAVAVNNTVIPKTGWDKYHLTENDSVTIITATAGG